MFGPQQKTYELFRGNHAPRQQVWCMDSEAQRRQWASHDACYPTCFVWKWCISSQMATLMGKIMGNHHATQLDNVNYTESLYVVCLFTLKKRWCTDLHWSCPHQGVSCNFSSPPPPYFRWVRFQVLREAILLFCWVVSVKLPFYVTLLISWMISLGFKWYLNHPFLGWSLGFLWLQRILSESAFIGVTCLDRTETITTPVDDATLLPEAPLAF